ncbi:hypothetical protein INS49_007778 [Diaporthe citri]|uniref:uncharacterized protein n=1 Tax=Diaporthe citri TaxID=83186 RepID=UPI001C7F9DA9|nr:uncharacterized protein INS49_007778 [Diaporthe citri]KAG6362685.1 hypothetical protein INS49_007778 [Diaporthe citri]
MSKGKGKEIATKPDWKEQLAMLDQELGWDEQEGSDWADSCEPEEQEVFNPNRPLRSENDKKNIAKTLQSTEKNHGAYSQAKQEVSSGAVTTDCDYTPCHDSQQQFGNGRNHAHYEPSDSIEDDEVMSADMQKTLWEAAVEETRSAVCVDTSTDALYDYEQEEDVDTASKQREEEEDLSEQQEEQDEEHFQPKSRLEAYIYHRFGPDINYENRCSCHERLYDFSEEQNKRTREYFAQAGGSNLIKDPCVLLPYPQDDLPGTENVDKPVLMVTTPEGETLYPHDMEEYPEPPAASWHGPRIGWGGAPTQGGHVVPYEDEDGADI